MSEPDKGTDDSPDYDDALPGAPTELAPSSTDTEAHTAWALDDGPEWRPPFWTPLRVTTVAVSVAALALVAAAGIAGYHLRTPPPTAFSAPTPSSTQPAPPATPPPAPTVTQVVPPPPETVTVTADAPAVPGDDFPTAAEIDALDRQLLISLRRQGWSIWDEREMAIRAHQLCAELDSGRMSPSAAIEYFQRDNASDDAQEFVTTVMAIYPQCP